MTTPLLITNTSDVAKARSQFLGGLGLGIDAKRPTAWAQYGYPETVTFDALLQAYRRGGAGHGAVHKLLDGCWQQLPRIKKPKTNDETPWEQGVIKVLKKAKAWARIKDADRRSLIGTYAALIYRVADSQPLNTPIKKATRLVDLIPVYEGQIKVSAWDTDKDSESYGQPTMFQYRRADLQTDDNKQGKPDEWADVHPSRVQLLYEGLSGDFTEGTPLLRAGFNRLIDLEKIAGGSGESFLKNSARTVVFKYDAGAVPQAIQTEDGKPPKSVKEAHEEQAQAMNRSIDASIVMQGGDAATLQTTISDPTGPWTVAANEFAASVRIPFTILFGQQTGRLASDEDKTDFANRCSSRQENNLTPVIEEFVERMQAIGIIEAGEFEVEWPPVNAPNEKDKAELLGKMTSAMQQGYQAGLVEPLFDTNELRAVMGYEQRDDDGMPTEGNPDALSGNDA